MFLLQRPIAIDHPTAMDHHVVVVRWLKYPPGETKNDPNPAHKPGKPAPGPTPRPWQEEEEKRNHTGSVVVQAKKDRDAVVGDSAGSKSERSPPSVKAIHLGQEIKILSLNIEGLSMAKCEYLARLAADHNIEIIALHETHLRESSPPSRYSVNGYTVISRENHEQYGIIVYSRNPASVEILKPLISRGNIHRSLIRTGNTIIANIYKPPQSAWNTPPLPALQHLALALGDFNSHHYNWGNHSCNKAGEAVAQWASENNMHLVFSPKDRVTFFSSRWCREYNPDLLFVSKDDNQVPLPVEREVLRDFPNSQHTPILITFGRNIPLVNSLPLPRWNFPQDKLGRILSIC